MNKLRNWYLICGECCSNETLVHGQNNSAKVFRTDEVQKAIFQMESNWEKVVFFKNVLFFSRIISMENDFFFPGIICI